ncbi:nitrogen regulatory protein P-II 1 [Bacillus coahuilensis p1.1.43]|uniref:Nitrogen regulatory protein P-II 1 n=1 Tax=Bacillus coahuilensis p1.1.43 TaxID=1150625 RepID=A0A147KAL3_9BACI|nr:P-II family nitrogen regulator [Bacillus coahuilensis]KUP07758.1 nitrogen regulatory protein P-II 1 [Bacillus coahuilensis p1.1.43]
MKKIEAIIRPEAFQTLKDGLSAVGISGLTVTEAAGCGKQQGKKGVFRGTSFEIQLVPRVKVEMVIEESRLDEIVDVIIDSCSTDTIGDGKIFISSIEEVIRIRSGERGKEAVL